MRRPPRARRTTTRLTLEPVAESHAPRLWAAVSASLAELTPWLSWTGSATLASTRAFAAEAEQQWADGSGFHFLVAWNREIVGGVRLTVDPRAEIGEIGYWIRSDRTGRGFATEAAGSLVELAFGELALRRLELRAGIGNRGSLRVAEKLGFRREGRLREAGRGARSRYDCYMYGLLSSDERPSARPPAGRED